MNDHSADDHSADVPVGPDPARPEVPEPAPVPGVPDVVARLRAADPAAGAEPDDGLWAAVAARVETQAAARPDELAARRARRWTSWPARAAGVAAAALLVGGGGGYAIGAAGSDGSDADPAAPVIMLDNGSGAGAPEAAAEAGDGAYAEGSAPAGDTTASGTESLSAPGAGGGAEDRAWYWSGRTVFTSAGLSEEGGSATAWAFDPVAAFTEERVAAAAAALGVAGAPVLTDGYWTVGPTDGSGPGVSVYADGMVSLNYYDPGKDPWACPTITEEQRTAEEADPSLSVVPEPDPCVQRDLGPAPAGEDAAAIVRDAMVAVGVDPAGFELVAENYGDPLFTFVNAYQVVDGQRTGVAWSGSLTGAGLQSLYGPLAPLVDLGEYSVVSPAAAVERLSDPRFGVGGGGPMAWVSGMEPTYPAAEPGSGPPPLPPAAQPGSAFRWPVSEATIVEARLGLAMHSQVDGSTVLLPSYELTSADGGIWSVIAVDESHLDFSDAR